MKNQALSITFFLFTLVTITAQDINFGAKAGVNIASIKFEDKDYSTSPRIGAHVGGFVNYEINEKLSGQLEVFYSMGGNKWDYDNGDTTGKVKTSMISIPLLAQYEVIEHLSAEAGIQYNFLLSVKQKIDDVDDSFEDLSKYYKTGSFGFALGALYQLDMLVPGLAAGLRYTRDLTKLNNSDVDAGKIKQGILQINFVYTLSN
ncbi:porin family protein [Winogradskyella schleiferi]|uniref:porin family protein n=1 Tax=Winogradskyella schleiferi TaxID=2686078 RepID=UPI0015BC39AC|nr:porin family protein [Winogradskyella schleiferi]